MSSFRVPEERHTAETIVKKSQFLCYIAHCEDRNQAQAFIQEIRAVHPNANHNCWAYIAGSPDDPSCWAMNDDGEPKGCAGKPMFNVIQHSGIGEICVVVSRYFGGIKLGTGGMARAYSGAVQAAITTLSTTAKHYYQNWELRLPYALHSTIVRILDNYEAITNSCDFGAEIILTASLREDSIHSSLLELQALEYQGVQLRQL